MTTLPTGAQLVAAANVSAMQGLMSDQATAISEMPGGAVATTLTIAAGAVTPTVACHLVDTEAAAASDDLTNIVTTNHTNGRRLLISMVDAARIVTVKHNAGGAGQIALVNGYDLVLKVGGWVELKRTGANWEEVGRSQNLISTVQLSGPMNESYATVASHATAADIWGAKGNVINFTGTATVTAFPAAPQAGVRRRLICASTCSFTSAAGFVVDGGSYTAAAGDVVDVEAVTTTSFKLHPIPVSGVVSGQRGGTGVANTGKTFTMGGNVTFSGAYTFAATLTANTTVTFPTTGTLSTLAGAEELTNKTLNASVGKGTWTTSGTWTLPAFTAGGAITLGGSGNSIDTSGNITGTSLRSTGGELFLQRATASTMLQVMRYWDGTGTTPLIGGSQGDNLVIGNRDGSGEMVLVTAGAARARLASDGTYLRPEADNAMALGGGSNRWSTVYAGTGTINTSDAREKTSVSALTAAEINAAKALSHEIGTYKFLSTISVKGDAARRHVGMTVQRAVQIMEQHGLDPFTYGFICYDTWEDKYIDCPAVEAQEATEDSPAVEAQPARCEQVQWAGDRYSFRPDELLMFIARGLDARLTAAGI